ncbi:hypothetical protein DSM101010T_16660 [Desulfovibrio subterraneus]|uniref:Lipoprotein n=2 Tax=Desulfovibrio subterraneus TaxID=2718620 RepID=A0A7J0BJ82_9BACT|nr:hypothetical protein DSM101010T_16660 [Desulfovibrio subterraneus]
MSRLLMVIACSLVLFVSGCSYKTAEPVQNVDATVKEFMKKSEVYPAFGLFFSRGGDDISSLGSVLKKEAKIIDGVEYEIYTKQSDGYGIDNLDVISGTAFIEKEYEAKMSVKADASYMAMASLSGDNVSNVKEVMQIGEIKKIKGNNLEIDPTKYCGEEYYYVSEMRNGISSSYGSLESNVVGSFAGMPFNTNLSIGLSTDYHTIKKGWIVLKLLPTRNLTVCGANKSLPSVYSFDELVESIRKE